ncbi:MAG: hypothetical protein A2901_02790 [Elusimicrobia bacterium RIFCSPLOWO2_01_FULL_54_10]|nr:MAG: hypothetical protein A2901_02790 [Elusimicrobia bacterium RIFCSPLOWO2_01_FULL_54_10]
MKILLLQQMFENTNTGYMPKFAQADRADTVKYPPLGLLYVASYLMSNGYPDVTVRDADATGTPASEVLKEIAADPPDLVAIPAFTNAFFDVHEIAKGIKKINPKAHICIAGPHVKLFRSQTLALPEIDSTISGDGEVPFLRLVDYVSGKVQDPHFPGLSVKTPEGLVESTESYSMENMDALPFPVRTAVDITRYHSIVSSHKFMTTMISMRGCPHQCTFCAIDRNVKMRSAENVVQEMVEIAKLGIHEIHFVDETLNLSRQRLISICKGIIASGIKVEFSIRCRVKPFDDEMMRLLKEAGCMRIFFGIESGSQRILDKMKKHITLKDIQETINLVQKYKLEWVGFFLFAFPGETYEEARQTIEFAKKLNPNFAQFTVFTPVPGAPLYEEAMKDKSYKPEVYNDFTANPTKGDEYAWWETSLTKEQINGIIEDAYREFYFRPSYILRSLMTVKSFTEFSEQLRIGVNLFASVFK